MGKWVILIGDTGVSSESIKTMAFQRKIEIKNYGEKQFDVFFKDGYVSFQFDYDGSDYPPDEIKKLPYTAPQFVIMRYSSQRVLERVIGAEDFPKNVLIDCDGVDLGLEQVVDRHRLLNHTE